MVCQLHKTLASHVAADSDQELTTINAAIRGSDSTELIQRYVDRLHLLKPDVVVVNLSHNDSYRDSAVFASNLAKLVEFSKSQGSVLLFVQEANSSETDAERLAVLQEHHRIMRDIAGEHKVNCADLHGYLSGSEIRDSGLLWWDYVHLTSYGHELAGEFLARHIAAELSKR